MFCLYLLFSGGVIGDSLNKMSIGLSGFISGNREKGCKPGVYINIFVKWKDGLTGSQIGRRDKPMKVTLFVARTQINKVLLFLPFPLKKLFFLPFSSQNIHCFFFFPFPHFFRFLFLSGGHYDLKFNISQLPCYY